MFSLCVRNSLATLCTCKSTGGSQVCTCAHIITFSHMYILSWSQAGLRADPPTKAPLNCCLGFMPRCHATPCRLCWYLVCMDLQKDNIRRSSFRALSYHAVKSSENASPFSFTLLLSPWKLQGVLWTNMDGLSLKVLSYWYGHMGAEGGHGWNITTHVPLSREALQHQCTWPGT